MEPDVAFVFLLVVVGALVGATARTFRSVAGGSPADGDTKPVLL